MFQIDLLNSNCDISQKKSCVYAIVYRNDSWLMRMLLFGVPTSLDVGEIINSYFRSPQIYLGDQGR